MVVMSNYVWKDSDIEKVLLEGHENNREICFKEQIGAIVICREDVIALAREFDLFVFDKKSELK